MVKVCDKCKELSGTVEHRRMSTQYLKEEDNFIEVCQDCFDEIEYYWEENWREYYAERL